MDILLYFIAGFAVGFEVGKMASGNKVNWKRLVAIGLIAFAIATVVAFILN